jgi:hypothetical protein
MYFPKRLTVKKVNEAEMQIAVIRKEIMNMSDLSSALDSGVAKDNIIDMAKAVKVKKYKSNFLCFIAIIENHITSTVWGRKGNGPPPKTRF